MIGRQGTALEAHDRIRDAVLAALGNDATRVQPALLQPAADLLAHYGEALRARACTFTDAHGGELFLVPDYTVPICRMHLARGGGSGRYVYAGPVFRPPAPGDSEAPVEEFQVGLEIFGDRDPLRAEAEILRLAVDAMDRAGLRISGIAIGDTALGPAILSALPVSEHRRTRLERRLGQPARLRALLDRFTHTNPRPVTPERDATLTRFHSAENPEAETLAVLEEQGIPLVGQRRASEIGTRIQELAAERDAAPMSAADAARLESLLAVSIPYARAAEELRGLATEAGIDIDPALDQLAARRDALIKAGIDLAPARLNARLGHDLGYYDGFAFEIFADTPEGPRKIAGGGRYDRLPRALGGAVPAIGVAVWTGRILACTEAEA